MFIDLLVILNNFLHDLAAAMWFCGSITLFLIVRQSEKLKPQTFNTFAKDLFHQVKRITNYSLAVIFLGGIVRALNYQKYEWVEALGRGQVTLLIIKHILLFGIVITGIYIQFQLSGKIQNSSE